MVASAAFSPDGTRVVSASHDETVRVWETTTGKQLLLLKGHERGANSARFSPHGKRIVVACGNNEAKIWDAENGKQIATLAHSNPVESAFFDGTGYRVITVAFPDKVARIWDAETGALLDVLSGHSDTVLGVAFNPVRAIVATASLDKSVRFWSSNEGGATAALPKAAGETGKTVVQFNKDDSKIIADSGSGFEIWDAKTLKWIGVHGGFTGSANQVSANKYRAFYVHGDYTHGMTLGIFVDFERKSTDVRQMPTSKNGMTLGGSTLLSDDGSKALLSYNYEDAFIVDPNTGVKKNSVPCVGSDLRGVNLGPFSRDGSKLFVVGAGSEARLCDAEKGTTLHEFVRKEFVESGAFNRDATRILAAGTRIRLIDTENWNDIRAYSDVATRVHSASFNATDTQIVGALDDKTVRVWDVATGKELLILRGHGRAVQSASFSTDGARIVSSATDETVRLWDVPYLQMSRDELLLSACQGRLRGARKLSREEMRHIGEPDSAPEIDACADVTEGPEGPEGALQKELGPLFSAPTPADMIASVAPIRRLDVLLEPVWNTPEQRVPTNLLYNPLQPQPPEDPFKEPVLPPRQGKPDAMDKMVDAYLARQRAYCNSGKGFKITSSAVRDEKGKIDDFIKKDEIFVPLMDNHTSPRPGLCHVKYSDDRRGYVGLTAIIGSK